MEERCGGDGKKPATAIRSAPTYFGWLRSSGDFGTEDLNLMESSSGPPVPTGISPAPGLPPPGPYLLDPFRGIPVLQSGRPARSWEPHRYHIPKPEDQHAQFPEIFSDCGHEIILNCVVQ